MRILMVSDVYFPRVNGVSTSIRTFRRELLALGHHVTLIAPAYAGGSFEDADVIRVPSRGVPRDPEDRMMKRAYLARLLPALRKDNYDVLHIHTPFVAHYAGLDLARQLNLPVVESYHTFFEEYLHHYVPLVPRAWMRFAARRFTVAQCNAVDRIVSPSRAMQDALLKYGVRTAIEVLPTGLEANQFVSGNGARFRMRHGIDAKRPVLLYVGRVAHEKNIDFLLRSFRAVLAQLPQALLLIVGEGPALEHLQRLAGELDIANSVRFIGYLDRDTELLDCYSAGDLFVFASRTETQGLVLLEALAQGVPVLSTMHMGTREVLHNTPGVQVAAEDVIEFARLAVALLQDGNRRQELARHAPAAARRWSSREMAERLLRCYTAASPAMQRLADAPAA
jgi:1,2-diacylglycerol 3-alpha-glucosyltransferase